MLIKSLLLCLSVAVISAAQQSSFYFPRNYILARSARDLENNRYLTPKTHDEKPESDNSLNTRKSNNGSFEIASVLQSILGQFKTITHYLGPLYKLIMSVISGIRDMVQNYIRDLPPETSQRIHKAAFDVVMRLLNTSGSFL